MYRIGVYTLTLFSRQVIQSAAIPRLIADKTRLSRHYMLERLDLELTLQVIKTS